MRPDSRFDEATSSDNLLDVAQVGIYENSLDSQAQAAQDKEEELDDVEPLDFEHSRLEVRIVFLREAGPAINHHSKVMKSYSADIQDARSQKFSLQDLRTIFYRRKHFCKLDWQFTNWD